MKMIHYLLMIILMGCALLVVGQLYVPISISSNISSQFNVTTSDATLVSSIFGFSYAAGFLMLGSLSDKYGRKTILVSGLCLLSLTTFIVSLSPNFTFLLIARAIQGFVASSFPPVALSLVTETLEIKKRPIGISLISLSFLASAPVIQLFTTWLGLNITETMLVFVPFYLAGALGLLLIAPKHVLPLKKKEFNLKNQFLSLLKDPSILVSWFIASTVLFSFVSFHAGMQTLGADLGINMQFLRFAGLPTLLFAFSASPLIHKFGSYFATQIGLIITLLAFVLGIFNSEINLFIASAILTAGVSITTPSLIATIAGRSNIQNRGFALSIYSFMLFLGASIAPLSAHYFSKFGLIVLNIVPISFIIIGIIVMILSKKLKFRISFPVT
ncbi:MFS transporter [Fluviispira multicolorata]|uniref:MFS transporter n=1 Tax=Fluviispira multicolorata TaxID=2654512 RepID=A0A833N6M8_9BACT|nr:MFS transporter [Fluviispira multicolorata]KAB8030728.1 MFS transporter [Fluviispira multicolorata]